MGGSLSVSRCATRSKRLDISANGAVERLNEVTPRHPTDFDAAAATL
jgi:hypothetical protein